MAGRSDLTPQQLSYFGVVQGASKQHLGTAEIWDAVKSEAARRGEALPAGMFSAVNQLRSYGSGLTYAAERVARAADNEAILSTHIGILPYGHNPGGTGGPRIFDVRVAYMHLVNNEIQDDYLTLRYTGGLPPTIGDLRQEANDIVSSMASGYGRSFVGISSIEIGEL